MPRHRVRHGAYVLAGHPEDIPELILIATGSEVSLALEAYEELTNEGIRARVVSMSPMELFSQQPAPYRDAVLPPLVTSADSDRAGKHLRMAPLGRN